MTEEAALEFARPHSHYPNGSGRVETKMNLEQVRLTIDSERDKLLSLKERVTSDFVKHMCQSGLNGLDDVECLCFKLKIDAQYLGPVLTLLDVAVNQRKAVDDIVAKWGNNAIAVPYDPLLKR